MSVPILDEAYMKRRAQLRYMQAISGYGLGRPRATAESLREEYARGALTFEQFERRLEAVLECA